MNKDIQDNQIQNDQGLQNKIMNSKYEQSKNQNDLNNLFQQLQNDLKFDIKQNQNDKVYNIEQKNYFFINNNYNQLAWNLQQKQDDLNNFGMFNLNQTLSNRIQFNLLNKQDAESLLLPDIEKQLERIRQAKLLKKQLQRIEIKVDDEMKKEQEIQPNHQSKANNDNKLSYDLDKGLTFEIKALNNYFQFNSEKDQVIPVMASVKTVDQTYQQNEQSQIDKRPSIDLVCVIDNSSSMRMQKIENVKTALLQLVDMLNENDRLSLILFNKAPTTLCNLRRVDKENKQKFKEIINQISVCGGTNIALGMDSAFTVLNERKNFNQVSSIFLLSDGQDKGAFERIQDSFKIKYQSLNDYCFTIHSFGFGVGHDGPLLNNICDLKDGNFYYVENVNQIDQFFVDALGGLFSVVAQEIQIEIKLNLEDEHFKKFFKYAKITKTYGDMWNVQKKGEIFMININQLFSGVSKDFIFEITVPKSSYNKLEDFERNLEVVKGYLSAIPVDIQYQTRILKESNLVLTLFKNNEPISIDAEVNDNVEFNYLRVNAAEAMSQAINFSYKQQYKEGQHLLEQTLKMIEGTQSNKSERIQILKNDILACQESAQPQIFETLGKYKMLSKKSANLKQTSQVIQDSDLFQNQKQKLLVSFLKQKQH